MNFVVFIQKTPSGYQAHLADFPGRFVENSSLELTMAGAAKAIEDQIREQGKLLFRKEGFPSSWEDWIGRPEVEGKTLANVDVDLRFLFKRAERVLISVPEYELYQIDKAAEKLGMNRSKFLARAGIEKARKI